MHLERSTEYDLLQALSCRVHGLFELGTRYKCRDLLQVERTTVRVEFVELWPVEIWQIVDSLSQIKQIKGHLAEELL